MSRRRIVAVAVGVGALAAGTYVVARPEPSPERAQPSRQPMRVELDRSAKPLPSHQPGDPATARLVARVKDPAGGPDWVLRTYRRAPLQGGRATVRCAQLGRWVGGRVAWVEPGASRATRLPLADAGTTVCAISAPISQRLGVNVGGMADGPPADPATRISTSVLWGIVDRPVAAASVRGTPFTGSVRLRHGAFLRVLASNAAPHAVRLTVRDHDGGRRSAIPPASFDELTTPGPMAAPPGAPTGPQPRSNALPPDSLRLPGDRFTVVSTVPGDRIGIVQALYARRVPGRPPCVSDAIDTIGGRPITSWYQGRIGLVREPLITCRFVTSRADRKPKLTGAGGSSGFDPDYPSVAAADRRALRERRRPPETTSMTVATPPGTRYLEVRSPVGISTARVSWARVTVIGWDGQPEVSAAMFPRYRKVHGRVTKIGGQGIWVRALDEHRRQIGRPTMLR